MQCDYSRYDGREKRWREEDYERERGFKRRKEGIRKGGKEGMKEGGKQKRKE